ncbi:uncharacterized protein LOC128741857 [Sabethes cyaneus]|uniref:uncharacterized protein LOC128741857 n=1 Tax=Sabethes cyaneus TaxID=53552 RepID=UPI00237DFB33|nr:uncharacterized protein LOC128741857 [Sabethes cyaneus]
MNKLGPQMFINDIENKEDITNIILSELREHGIKYRKEKRLKIGQEKSHYKRIFNVPLHTLELTDVILANGYVAQVPLFVSNACQRILEQINTEGLFRKAGSAKRQLEIKASIESGKYLAKSYHVIDIANILKTFFRDLPEPLLPTGNIQEALIRCLLSGEHKVHNLMITCLLLPPITVNTLAFFMQFLHTVSLHSSANKMTAENLAIIFAPNLMPIAQMIQQRLASHVKVIQLLIENSHKIGVIPESVFDKINDSVTNIRLAGDLHNSTLVCSATEKKKKKRRSGSITRMFHGLKKIVGAVGSSESLDKPDESLKAAVTPCLNKSKKRKVTDNMPFSAKKKKEVISSLPDTHEILPYTPITMLKDVKKSRLSLGGQKQKGSKHSVPLMPSSSVSSIVDSKPMERRWSLVSAPWSRKKRVETTNVTTGNKTEDEDDDEIHGRKVFKGLSPVNSLPNLRSPITEHDLEHCETQTFGIPFLRGRALFEDDEDENKCNIDRIDGEEYFRISKSEYEAIKERVAAIETRISQEFENIDKTEMDHNIDILDINCIADKYNMTLKTTEPIEANNSSTDQLAKRLSRELKIRRSAEHCMMRSPSARKIGSMRRRSRESARLSRNQSWHLGSSILNKQPVLSPMSDLSFYPKTNLKRGRPNTVQSGLKQPELSPVRCNKSNEDSRNVNAEEKCGMKWTNAETFFNNTVNLQNSLNGTTIEPAQEIFKTPDLKTVTRKVSIRSSEKNKKNSLCFGTKIEDSEIKTPMLPPRKTPSKISVRPSRTPGRLDLVTHRDQITPLQELQSGRASIARLRSQNAGMVLAKAKLFDGIVSNSTNQIPSLQMQKNRHQNEKHITKVVSETFSRNSNQMDETKSISPLVQNNICATVNYSQKKQQKSTPRKRACAKSPHGGINRREKLRVAGKSATKVHHSPRLIRHLRDESHLLKSCKRANIKVHASPNLYDLDNNTPHVKRESMRNSPRRLVDKKIVNNKENKRFNPSVRQQTPLKENSLQKLSLVSHSGYIASNNNARREWPRLLTKETITRH